MTKQCLTLYLTFPVFEYRVKGDLIWMDWCSINNLKRLKHKDLVLDLVLDFHRRSTFIIAP